MAIIKGTSSSENLSGSSSNDSIYGYGGNDTIFALSGNDLLKGGSGKDGLYGGSGDDSVFGGSGDDSLLGQDGNDKIYGGEGSDRLIGYTGNDKLVGGDGDDTLTGAGIYQDSTGPQSFGVKEIDILTGGAGEDTFILWGGSGRAGINVYYDAAGTKDYALITDFKPNEDIIELTSKVGGTFSPPTKVTYSLGESPDGLPSGTGLFVNKPGSQQELIAILENVSSDYLSLDGNYFSYYS